MATAQGVGTDLNLFGYIEAGQRGSVTGAVLDFSTADFAVTGVTMAAAVWDSYTGLLNGKASTTVDVDASYAYYFAMQSFAEQLLRIRVGNIGANPDSNVAETIVEKAMALIGTCDAAIKEYEEFCAAQAKLVGSLSLTLISGAPLCASKGIDIARAHWKMISDDGEDYDHTGKFIEGVGYSYALQVFGSYIVQRQVGYAGARNPAVGQYYLNAAQAMISAGTAGVKKFADWAPKAKPQLTIMNIGL